MNLKNAIASLAMLCGALVAGAQGKDDVVVTPSIQDAYSTIKISGDFRVEYCPAGETLRMTARKNVLDNVECFVREDTLQIKYVEGKGAKAIMSGKSPVICIPFSPDVHKVILAGTVHMESKTTLALDDISFKLSGASRLIATTEVQNLAVHCAGTSNVTISGKADSIDIRIDGASRVSACEGFECNDAHVDIKGSGVVRINCVNRLYGETSGLSIVKYLGEPKDINVKSNGVNGIVKM